MWGKQESADKKGGMGGKGGRKQATGMGEKIQCGSQKGKWGPDRKSNRKNEWLREEKG